MFPFAIFVTLLPYTTVAILTPSDHPPRLLEKYERMFYDACPLVASHDLPQEMAMYRGSFETSERLNISIWVTTHRITEINDLSQTMTLFMEVDLWWQCPCFSFDYGNITNALNITDNVISYTSLRGNTSKVWFPKLLHRNADSDAYPFDSMTPDIRISPYFSGGVYVDVIYYGAFTSSCDEFSFRRFPFDVLNCSVDFELTGYDDNICAFEEQAWLSQDAYSELVGDTDIWTLLAQSGQIAEATDRRKDKDKQEDGYEPPKKAYAKFEISLQRKSYYYGYNIFLPIVCLYAIQVVSLAIEPEAPDRAAFSMTVVLAFCIILSMVFALIPKTSEHVYLVNLVAIQLGISAVLTIYTILTQPFATTEFGKRKPKFFKGSITIVRLLDVAMAAACLITIGFGYAYYMTKMITGLEDKINIIK